MTDDDRTYDLEAHVTCGAQFARDVGEEDVQATATHCTVTVDAHFDVDRTFVNECVTVQRGGEQCWLYDDDVTAYVEDQIMDGYTLDEEDLTIEVKGIVDEWTTLALHLADSAGGFQSTNVAVARSAVQLLGSLAEHSRTTAPLLGALQLCDDEDLDVEYREEVYEKLLDRTDSETLRATVEGSTPQPADD